jgi:hypothetical protein
LEVFRLREKLVPVIDRLDIDRTDSCVPLSEEVCHEMAGDEAAFPTLCVKGLPGAPSSRMLAPSGEAPDFGGADGTVETTVVDDDWHFLGCCDVIAGA